MGIPRFLLGLCVDFLMNLAFCEFRRFFVLVLVVVNVRAPKIVTFSVHIIRLFDFLRVLALVRRLKGDSNALQDALFGHRMQKLLKNQNLIGRCFKIASLTIGTYLLIGCTLAEQLRK